MRVVALINLRERPIRADGSKNCGGVPNDSATGCVAPTLKWVQRPWRKRLTALGHTHIKTTGNWSLVSVLNSPAGVMKVQHAASALHGFHPYLNMFTASFLAPGTFIGDPTKSDWTLGRRIMNVCLPGVKIHTVVLIRHCHHIPLWL